MYIVQYLLQCGFCSIYHAAYLLSCRPEYKVVPFSVPNQTENTKRIWLFLQKRKPLAAIRGSLGTRPPLGPISFIFMQFLTKNLSNNKFLGQTQGLAPAPPPPHVWEILDPPLKAIAGVVLQFCVKKHRNKALFLKNKALFLKNKALLRIKVWVNFIFIFQNLFLNHFYCMLFSSWILVFPLAICFII